MNIFSQAIQTNELINFIKQTIVNGQETDFGFAAKIFQLDQMLNPLKYRSRNQTIYVTDIQEAKQNNIRKMIDQAHVHRKATRINMFDIEGQFVIQFNQQKSIRQKKQKRLLSNNFMNFLKQNNQNNKNINSMSHQMKNELKQLNLLAIINQQPNSVENMTQIKQNKKYGQELIDICGCCNQITGGQKLPYCIDMKKLQFCGPGTILFFHFVDSFILLLLMLLIVFGIFSITTDVLNNQFEQGINLQLVLRCNNLLCILPVLLSNGKLISDNDFWLIQLILALLSTIIFIIWFHVLRYRAKNQTVEMDVRFTTPSDYGVKLESYYLLLDLPPGQYTQVEVLETMRNKWNQINKKVIESGKNKQPLEQLQIIQIISSYYIEQFQNSKNQLIESISQIADLLRKVNGKYFIRDLQKYTQAKFVYEEKKRILEGLCNNFKADTQERRKIIGACSIVIFKEKWMRKKFMEHLGSKNKSFFRSLISFIFNKIGLQDQKSLFLSNQFLQENSIQVQKAPQPQDIIWQNCQYQISYCRILGLWLVTFLIIMFSLGIQIFLIWYQQLLNQYLSNQQDIKLKEGAIQFLGYIRTFATMILNNLISFSSKKLASFQRNHTITDQLISQSNRVLMGQILNTIFLPLLAHVIININTIDQKLYGKNSIAYNAFDYALSNMVIYNLLNFFDPVYWVKKLLLLFSCWRKRCKICLLGTSSKTQQQLNKYYEGTDFDLSSNYSYVVITILFTSFYMWIMPIIILFGIIGISIHRLLQKYLLLRRYKRPKMIDQLLYVVMIKNSQYFSLLFGLGILFSVLIEEDGVFTDKLTIPFIIVGLSLIMIYLISNHYINIALDKLYECFNKVQVEEQEEVQFNHQNFEYNIPYSISNPAVNYLTFSDKLFNRHYNEEDQLQYCEKFFNKFNGKLLDPNFQNRDRKLPQYSNKVNDILRQCNFQSIT